MSYLENRVPPPLLVLALGLAMWGASLALPPLTVNGSIRVAIVALLFATAAAFGAPAVRAFGRAKTTIDPVHVDRASAVVTSGVYGVTRNPMYVAMAFLLLSWAAYLAVPWTLAGPLVFVLFIDRYQIAPEERAMTARFGAAYTAYKSRVRRWL
jgi:protein-S-isoprenylcysteine O-methyltransferase Ste14